MPESTPTPAPLGRHHFYGRAPLPAADRTPAQKLRAEAPGAVKGTTATLRLYDPIDSYGGEFGVSAKEFAKVIDSLDASVNEIHLRINSPGGEVFDGIAIANTLRNHSAKVVAHIDGIAASAASFIAVSADEVIAGKNSQLMIHDAMGLAIGNARTMQDMVDVLDKISDNIASFYADKTGQTAEQWRTAMRAETWYSAEEAVEAGLADRVGEPADDAEAVTNRFDLSIFNYAGREQAPAPHMPPSASAVGSSETEGGSAVALSDAQIAMRQKLGLAEDADEATVLAALDEALEERADPPASPPATPVAASAPDQPAAQAQPAPAGTMVIDSSAWEAREERLRRLEATENKRRREERDQVINQAVAEGKFQNARVEHWQRLWDADPEGTRQVIDGLARGIVPVNELGFSGSLDDRAIDDEFGHLFPPSYSKES